MSTQPIIVQVVDQVDASIQVKIAGIATTAHLAATEVNNLQAALDGISGSSAINGVAASLAKITPVSTAVAQNALTLSKSLSGIGGPAVAATQTLNGLGAALAVGPSRFVPTNTAVLALSQGLGKIPVPARGAFDWLQNLGGASNTLTGRLATLAGRVVGMEVGLGRLGGAFAGVGVAAAGAAPFLIAALAIGAVVGAIVLYEKFRNEANALLDTQAALGKQFNTINDRILAQKETLAGLTDGPLAKYSQELHDLPLKNIDGDFSKIIEELKEQHSWWATIVSDVERFASARALLDVATTGLGIGNISGGFGSGNQKVFDVHDAEDFLHKQEQLREAGKLTQQVSKETLAQIVADSKKAADEQTFNQKTSLANQIINLKNQINTVDGLVKTSEGRTQSINIVSENALKDALRLRLLDWQEYLAKENTLRADAGKAATEEQLKQFNEEMARLKSSGGIVTAQQELLLRQQQLSGAARPTAVAGLDSRAALGGLGQTSNVRALTSDIEKLNAEINKQGVDVDNLVKRYQDTVAASGAYSVSLQVEAEYHKLLDSRILDRIPHTDELKQKLYDVAAAGVEETRVNREAVAIYNEFQAPIQKYRDALAATTQLLNDNAISAQQASIANAQAARAMQDAIDPLNEYKIGLQHEVDLLGQYGQQLTVATEIDRIRQGLQKQGRDLDQQSIDTLTKFLTLLDQQKVVQEDETRLWEQNEGAKQKILEQQLALNKAYFDGVINLAQWKAGALDAALATNKLNNEITGGTLKTNIVQLYGGLIQQLKGAHPVIQALQTDFGTFFASLKKGFADSIAHVLVFGGSLKTALLDTARNAVAQLISSLIELGIEFLIVTALSKLFHISLPSKDDNSAQKQLEQMAVAVAAIAVITAAQLAAINVLMAPAWALAEAISLASFGANAAAATAGITAVVAAGAAAQSAGRFAEGGMIQGRGTGTSDDILARLSNGEFVVNARATSKNRDVLEAINRNEDVKSIAKFAAGGLASIVNEGPAKLPAYALGGLIEGHDPIKIPAFATGGIVGDEKDMPAYARGGMVHVTIPTMIPEFATGGFVSSPDYNVTNVSNLVTPSVKTSVQMNVNVEHDGSTNVQVEHVDENTVRIIARQEAKNAVQTHSSEVISADIHNPNSRTSKALTRNYDVTRKR